MTFEKLFYVSVCDQLFFKKSNSCGFAPWREAVIAVGIDLYINALFFIVE